MGSNKNLIEELRTGIANMPEREWERLRRINLIYLTRLDVTHPPTVHRAEMLKAHRVSGRKVMLSPSESSSLEQELAFKSHP
jgi:hypothetical protein